MNVQRPYFFEGVHWRRLLPSETAGKPWKYVLLRDMDFIFLPYAVGAEYIFRDRDGIQRGSLTPGILTVCKGYTWNGCSFSPDLELLASLPHDLLYQFSGVPGFPPAITRRWADRFFAALCTTALWWAYRLGLCLGSWTCWGRNPDGLLVEKVDTPIR